MYLVYSIKKLSIYLLQMDCGNINCSGISWKYGYSIYLLKGTIDTYCLRVSDEQMEEGVEEGDQERIMRTRCIAMFVVKAD